MTRIQGRRMGWYCFIAAAVLSLLSLARSIAEPAMDMPPAPVTVTASVVPTIASSPSAPSPSTTTATSSVPPAVVVVPGRPTELRIPSIGLQARIHAQPCPLKDGALTPATYREACYYTAPDKPYQLPGSSTSDLSVLAGHTWRTGEAVFNPLYDWRAQAFRVRVSDELWLKTDTSGDRLLVYRALQTNTPAKGDGPDSLMNSSEIWGADGQTKPGLLLTIACLQPDDMALRSSRNVVIAWQYVGTRPAATP